jgi:hypothetical protein
VENTRPIAIFSHLKKVMDRAIINKAAVTGSRLLSTGSYQAGYKKQHGYWDNNYRLLKKLKSFRRRDRGPDPRCIILIDLTKAFDKVLRVKLLQILHKRCDTDSDHLLLYLIS